MKMQWKLPSAGRAYAYAGQIGGFALSFWANIRDAYIPEIPDGVPGAEWREGYPGYKAIDPSDFDLVAAGFFPVALFVAIELLARVDWKDTKTHTAARWLGVGGLTLVALIVSYSHLRTGFLLAGWNNEMASLAPLAIDGFMVLCTIVLLITGHGALKNLDQPVQENHHRNPDQPVQEMFHHPVQPVVQASVPSVLDHPGPAAPAAVDQPSVDRVDQPVVQDEPAAQSPDQDVVQEPVQVSQERNVEVDQDTVDHPVQPVVQPSVDRPARPRSKPAKKPVQPKVVQGKTDPVQMAKAVEAVRSKRLSLTAAAKEYGVPKTSLGRAVDKADAPAVETKPVVEAPTVEELERMFAGPETENDET